MTGNRTDRSTTVTHCRSCGSGELRVFLDLGSTPLADRLIAPGDLQQDEPRFPLKVAFCSDCSLVQITETVDPDILFRDRYPYYSSISPWLLAQARDNALNLIGNRRLGPGSFVVELASNDGYLLKNYVEHGIPVLGIDPADGPAAAAEKIGVPTRNDFFTKSLAETLRREGKQADVVHANNVLAHVADTNGFVAGLRILLKDDGVAVIEVPYLKDLIDNIEFDTVYHEHLCYFSVTALDRLFRRHGLYLNEIRHLAIHGGSLRLFVEPTENVGRSVTDQLVLEEQSGLTSFRYFMDFSERVHALKKNLLGLLETMKRDGRSIAAYGAAAKGATMINYMGIGPEVIDYVVDQSIHKHGKFMPGRHIPIRPTEALMQEPPDAVLLLAWNFRDEIMTQQAVFRERGGKFIIPIPEPRLV